MTYRINHHTEKYYWKKYNEKKAFLKYANGIFEKYGANKHEFKEMCKCHAEIESLRINARIELGLELPEVEISTNGRIY